MRIELAIPISEDELILSTSAICKKRQGRLFKYLSTDTRELKPGDLFIGLPGERFSDTDFITEAKNIGALTVSSSEDSDYTVKKPRAVLLDLAEYYRKKLTKLYKTIAITGSYGKTTTKSFLSTILGVKYKVFSTRGNNNNDIGLPLTILSAPYDCEVLVLECGTNAMGEISALAKCARPDIAIITSIGTSHIQNFGTRENIAKEKLDILSFGSPRLICPDDEPLLSNCTGIKVGDRWAIEHSFTPRERDNMLLLDTSCGTAPLPFKNKALTTPLMLSLAAAKDMGMSDNEITSGVSNLGPRDLRYHFIKLPRYSLIDDAYNASIETIIGAVDNLLTESAKYHSALIGDILELGEHTELIHRELGRELAKKRLSRLFLYGNCKSYILGGIKDYGHYIGEIILLSGTVDDIAKRLDNILFTGELLLIKGSHKTGLYLLPEKLKALNCK